MYFYRSESRFYNNIVECNLRTYAALLGQGPSNIIDWMCHAIEKIFQLRLWSFTINLVHRHMSWLQYVKSSRK